LKTKFEQYKKLSAFENSYKYVCYMVGYQNVPILGFNRGMVYLNVSILGLNGGY